MEMKCDTPLDHAVFQLSPKRSRCELFVSSNGNTEKLASGLVKSFTTHLKVAEEQVAQTVQPIKLEIERHKNAETWFTKATLERFVQFVSTPEVLEMVITLDEEMSQLEAARKIYSLGPGNQRMVADGDDGTRTTTAAAADKTKKELLRAIDVRLSAVRQDLTSACARAYAAGFNPDSVSELEQFADRFGAHRLHEACAKFMSLYQRRPDLTATWTPGGVERELRSSVGSDMSIDDPTEPLAGSHNSVAHHDQCTWQQRKPFATFASQCGNGSEKDEQAAKVEEKTTEGSPIESSSLSSSTLTTHPARRLSVQDRINLFENKQEENSSSSSSGGKLIVGKSAEFRRFSSDASVGSTVVAAEKSVLRRWSGASDMSIDVTSERKHKDNSLCTPSSGSSVSRTKSNIVASVAYEGKDHKNVIGCSSNTDLESTPRRFGDVGLKDQVDSQTLDGVSVSKEEASSNAASRLQFRAFAGRAERVVKNDQGSSRETTKVSAFGEERAGGYKARVDSETKSSGFSDPAVVGGAKYQFAPQIPVGDVTTPVEDITSAVKFSGRRGDRVMKNCTTARSNLRGSHSHTRSFYGQFEGGFGLKFKEAPFCQVEVDQTGESEEVMKNSSVFSMQKIKAEDSDIVRKRNQKAYSGSYEHISKSGIKRDETQVTYENSKLNVPRKELSESQVSVHVATIPPLEQFQRPRQSKGNQALNDELKMKADELEKLFAEHKQRVPGDQYGSARRIDPTDTREEQSVNSQDRRPGPLESTSKLPCINNMLEPAGSCSCSNVVNFDGKAPVKMVKNHNYGDSIRLNFLDLNFGDNSRGKFYERYMQKRDAKLREEWSSKKSEKEAKMKAMQDNLEKSRAEMKAKFSGSIDRKDSVSAAQRHTEKVRSFHLSKKKEQTDLGPCDHLPRSLLKKGNNTSASVVRMKASLALKAQNTEEFDEPMFEGEYYVDVAREEYDETETMVVEDCAYTNNGKVRLNLESEKYANSRFGDSTRSLLKYTPLYQLKCFLPCLLLSTM